MPQTPDTSRKGWPRSARLTVLGLLCCVGLLAVHSLHPARLAKRYIGKVHGRQKMKHLRSMVLGVGTVAVAVPAAASAQATLALPPEFAAQSQIPRVLMTAAYPLNKSIADLPADTRMLKSGNPYTPKPIVDVFYQTFGPNHLQFNTTMPITVIDSKQTPNLSVPIKITTNWGSDDASHVPATGCRVEGGPAADPGSDLHCIIYDTATGMLHEVFGTNLKDGKYSAAAYRRWNTNKNEQGKPGQNSADAAGLPILPLLLRYSEASTGPVNHALRFTVTQSRNNTNGGPFTLPASHAAGQNWGSTAYMGMRLRLRADFDASSYSPMNQTIITTLKNYGLVLADNGISGLVVADDDPRWNGDDLQKLGSALTLRDFIPVNSGPIIDASGQPAQ